MNGGAALLLILAIATPTHVTASGEEDALPGDSSRAVRSSRTRRTLLESPQAISVVDREEFSRGRPGLGLDEALDGAPGVLTQSAGNFAQDPRISIRGYGARAPFGIRGIRVYLDGVPTTLADGQTEVDSLDLAFVERVEVLRSSSSALFGGGGGALFLTSPEPTLEPTLRVRSVFGSHLLARYEALATGHLGPVGWVLGGAQTRIGGYRNHAHARQYSGLLKLERRFSDGTRLRLHLSGVRAPSAQDAGGLTRDQIAADRRQARPEALRFDTGEWLHQERVAFDLERPLWGSSGSLRTDVTTGDLGPELRVRGYLLSRRFRNSLPTQSRGRVSFERVAGGGSVLLSGKGARLRWVTGVDVDLQRDDRRRFDNLDGVRGPLRLDQREGVRSVGAFGQVDWRIGGGLGAVMGVRYDWSEYVVADHLDSDGNQSSRFRLRELSPRLGLYLDRSPRALLYANLLSSFRPPTTTELAPDPTLGGGFASDLRAERSRGLEIGARGRLAERLFYDIVLYTLRIRDAIVTFDPGVGPLRARNAGDIRRMGFELGLGARLGAGLETRLAYTWSRFRYRDFGVSPTVDFGGNREVGTPRQRLNLELRWRHDSGAWAVLSLRHLSDIPVDDANTLESPGRTLSDLRLGFDWRRAHALWRPFVAVRNLSNVGYDGQLRPNAFGGRSFEPAPRREIRLGLEVQFGGARPLGVPRAPAPLFGPPEAGRELEGRPASVGIQADPEPERRNPVGRKRAGRSRPGKRGAPPLHGPQRARNWRHSATSLREARRLHSAGGMFCLRFLLAIALAASPLCAARAVERPPDSRPGAVRSEAARKLDRAFRARLSAWVEESLVSDEIDAAVSRLPEPLPDRSLEVLDRLLEEEIGRDRGPTNLPKIARPGLVTPGIHGEALHAAQQFAQHHVDDAIEILRELDLKDDPAGAHLLLQVLETRGLGRLPLFTLQFIDAYRRAIRLEREGPMADRARLRIGQLYLSIRFYREAVAALVGFLKRDIGEGFRRSARLSLVEAALLDRQPQLALDTIDRIDVSSVGVEAHRWVADRRGDALMDLHRSREAEAAYQSAVDDLGRGEAIDPALGLKLALAHLESRWPRRAPAVLGRVLEADPTPREASLAELLFARALRTIGTYDISLEHANRAAKRAEGGENSPLQALAAVSTLEAARLGGSSSLNLATGTSRLVTHRPGGSALALLKFETLIADETTSSDDEGDGKLEKLGALFISLPQGKVRTLVRQELADRMRGGLRALLAGSRSREEALAQSAAASPAATRRALLRWLGSAQLDDDEVLLATESFWRMGDRSSCERWARILRERELRPLERGLATWRGISCSKITQPTEARAKRLLREAERGDAGPFALALASLAAEIFVERGDLDAAISIYKRSLESIAEPHLAGPVGVRTGMLLSRQHHDALAIPRLRRGIAQLDGALARDPLRSVGLLTLLRVARRVEDRGLIRHILKAEVRRADGWWSSAFRYIGFRSGILGPPTGANLFALAAIEIRRSERVRRGLPPTTIPEGASP